MTNHQMKRSRVARINWTSLPKEIKTVSKTEVHQKISSTVLRAPKGTYLTTFRISLQSIGSLMIWTWINLDIIPRKRQSLRKWLITIARKRNSGDYERKKR